MRLHLVTTSFLLSLSAASRIPVPRNPEPADAPAQAPAQAMAGINLPREASLPLITSAPDSSSPLLARQDKNPESPSPCFTEVVTTTTNCKAIGECTSGPHTSLVCHADYICRFDSQGNTSCMYRESSLGVAGTIIAICFAVAIVVSVFSICFLCCRERTEQARLEKAAEAQKLLKESKVQAAAQANKRGLGRSVSGGVSGMSNEGSGYGGAGGDVGAQNMQGGQGNPFSDGGEGALR